jgi:transcriptional regulator with XRE-family HTH domain
MTEPDGEVSRPFQGSVDQTRLTAALDLSQQEKSLEALGRTFKAKRESNGLTRRDVVVKIKIPMDQLESIEDGRLSTLPPVFAKGFLRAYANELGLDAEAMLDHYRQLTGAFNTEPAGRETLPSRYAEVKLNQGDRHPVRRLLAVLTFLALGLAVAFWLRPDFWVWRAVADRLPASIWNWNAAPPEPVRPEGEREDGPALSQAEQPVVGAPEVAVASGSLAGAAPAEERAAPNEAKTEALALGGELTLVSQKDEIWLQIIVDGQPVKHYWLRRGQTIVQRAAQTVVVRTGQATALTATWNGRELGALSVQPVVEASFPPG